MTSKILVSIIVPVYKAEKYIDKCIISILKQTYTNYELILVDDGSPDRCPEICDQYAIKYHNIIVFHKKNGGLSDARNYGVERARGEYITFIDADDYVSEQYLEKLISLKNRYNADISVGKICVFNENEEKKIKKYMFKEEELLLSGLEALERMLYQRGLDTSACAMLLPRNVVQKNSFPYGKYHEDEFTTYKFYASVTRVAVTTEYIYFYVQRKGSITHTFGQASVDELDAADNLVEVCASNWPRLVKAAKSKKFSDYCQVFLSVKGLKKENPDMYKRIYGYLSKEKMNIIFDKEVRLKNRMAAIALLGGVNSLLLLNWIKNRR